MKNVSEYRWNEAQACQLLLTMNATAKLSNLIKPRKTGWWHAILRVVKGERTQLEYETDKVVNESQAEFTEDETLVKKTLEGASMPDDGWKAADIKEFLISGKKPVSAVSALTGRGLCVSSINSPAGLKIW